MSKTVKGYKATKIDMTCRHMKYEIGKTYKHNGVVNPCDAGFHFCENLEDVYDYYVCNCRVFEVIGSGKIIKDNNKTVCSEITFVREIDPHEIKNKQFRSNVLVTRQDIEIFDDMLNNINFDFIKYQKYIKSMNGDDIYSYYGNKFIQFLIYASSKGYKCSELLDHIITNREINHASYHTGIFENLARHGIDFDYYSDNVLLAIIDAKQESLYHKLENIFKSTIPLTAYDTIISEMIYNNIRMDIVNSILDNYFNKSNFCFCGTKLLYALAANDYCTDVLIENIDYMEKKDYGTDYSDIKVEILKHHFIPKYLHDRNIKVVLAAIKSFFKFKFGINKNVK